MKAMPMNEAWSSLLQTILWFSIIIYLIFRFRELFGILPRILKKRLEEGAPFRVGPVEIGTPPEAIKRGEKGGVTSEGIGGIPTSEKLELLLMNRNYPDGISDEFYLVHSWELLESSSGRDEKEYRVRIWLECVPGVVITGESPLYYIRRVTYRLPQSFPRQIIATEAQGRNFELWLNISSEINIIAYLEMRNNTAVWLSRHITLPDRPQGPLPLLRLEFPIDVEVLGAIEGKPTVIYDDDWTARVKWQIPALDRTLTGYWEITFSLESIVGDNRQIMKEIIPLKPTHDPTIYTIDFNFKHQLLPPGLYSMGVVVLYRNDDNKSIVVMQSMYTGSIYIHKRTASDLRQAIEISVITRICDKNQEATQFITIDEPWSVHVEWKYQSSYEGEIVGFWKIELFLQSVGPSEDISLPPLIVEVKEKREPSTYAEDIYMEPGSVKPGTYRVLALVKNIDKEHVPTDLIGFSEEKLVDIGENI
jgi:hypothetical protein